MLKFMRNKVISIDRSKPNELSVHGLLDDDLYGLEIDTVFSQDELKILSISGKWYRWTTPECPRAIDKLQPAVGMRLEPGFRAAVAKIIGRGACRHFANLLIEMAHTAKNAKLVIEWQESIEKNPDQDLEDFVTGWVSTQVELALFQTAASTVEIPPHVTSGIHVPLADAQRPEGGIVIDLHVHTSPASPCSSIKAEDVIAEAKDMGLDGIVLTDHNHVWSSDDIKRLQQDHSFLVLRGNEIITEHGDVLVYGFDRDINELIKLADLRREVQAAGGFMTMAHPFRGFLVTGVEQIGLNIEQAAKREMFKYVDAIETLNGKVTPDENIFSGKVSHKLGLPGVGGSDVHETGTVGCYATEFTVGIKDETDLIEALHAGDFRPVRFR
jgi:hypothetical protein